MAQYTTNSSKNLKNKNIKLNLEDLEEMKRIVEDELAKQKSESKHSDDSDEDLDDDQDKPSADDAGPDPYNLIDGTGIADLAALMQVENGRGAAHRGSSRADDPNTSKRYTLGTSSSDDDEDVAISDDRRDSDDDNSRPLPDAI